MTYLLINFCSVIVPLLFSFHPKYPFYKEWKTYLPAMFITAALFLGWDIYFTSIGVWGFNPAYVSGIYIAGLPIEEWLFFICIPYACVFSFFCLDRLIKLSISARLNRIISVCLVLFLLSGGLLNLSKFYTAGTFLLLAVMLTLAEFYFRWMWMRSFYPVYAILLIPFLIVNGLLTGTGLDAPVVWYNEAHILGPRIMTIPFEDVFYGMLLILLNLAFYKYFSSRISAEPAGSASAVKTRN